MTKISVFPRKSLPDMSNHTFVLSYIDHFEGYQGQHPETDVKISVFLNKERDVLYRVDKRLDTDRCSLIEYYNNLEDAFATLLCFMDIAFENGTGREPKFSPEGLISYKKSGFNHVLPYISANDNK